MAKRNKKNAARAGGFGAAAAVAESEDRVSKSLRGRDDQGRPRKGDGVSAPGARPAGTSAAPKRRGFFDMYKPGQGYHVRVGTAFSLGVLVVWGAYFLWEKCGVISTGSTTKYIQVGIALATILIFGLLGYWALALNRKICDFLIATEGEMKKVNWTTRKEIIGSTKIVVLVVVALGTMLFLVDMFFMLAFNSLGILKTGGSLFGD